MAQEMEIAMVYPQELQEREVDIKVIQLEESILPPFEELADDSDDGDPIRQANAYFSKK